MRALTAVSGAWFDPRSERFTDMNTFTKESLDTHNKYRSKHQAPPMTWSAEMAKEAQSWADRLAHSRCLQHASKEQRKGDGENVYMCGGKADVNGQEVVDNWYSEIKKYDFKKRGFQSGSGHFTQVVWKGSKEYGVAKATSGDGLIFVVARYRPAGNLLSAFNDNVFPA
ncbi:hypothetical protein QZH41_002634 [Actinostola sp. cb2023]|nr:hypothetical protein QZH41_002634 [Actinostola sp. cb2023]